MIPSAFVSLSSIPLSPNGKVDRKALLAYDGTCVEPEVHELVPRTTFEQSISKIWSDVLQSDELGLNDNFFDLGGTSMTLIQVRGRLRDLVKRDIPLIELFEYPTISELARHLSRKDGRGYFLQPIQDRARKQKEMFKRQRGLSRER